MRRRDSNGTIKVGAEDRNPRKKKVQRHHGIYIKLYLCLGISQFTTVVTFIFQMNKRGTEKLNHLTKVAQHSAAEAQLELRPQ